MDDFPQFMRAPANRIATESQATAGAEGYVFDGVDGRQMAFWKCYETAAGYDGGVTDHPGGGVAPEGPDAEGKHPCSLPDSLSQAPGRGFGIEL